MTAINKEYIKKKVVEAIALMPFEVAIYRPKYNKRKEFEGYEIITKLTGILYKETEKTSQDSVLKDIGEIDYKEVKTFLVDSNTESIKVKKGDFFIYNNECWKVISLGENLDIYYEMQVQEHERIET